MSYVLVKVHYYPHCETPNVKKNGIKDNVQQNFYCKDCRKQSLRRSDSIRVQLSGANPRIKKQVCEMAMRGSGIRDTSNVLKMSAVTVIIVLRLWFKIHFKLSFEGTYENVIIDGVWSWVGKRKESKR